MHRLRLGLLGGLAVAVTVAGLGVARPFDGEVAGFVGGADAAPPTASSSPAPAGPAAKAATPAPANRQAPTSASARTTAAASTPLSLRIVTYNTLGGLHTEPGGDMQYRAPAELRAQFGADVLRQQKPDIVGFQELRPNQITSFRREFPTFAFWPDNAVGSIGRPTTMMWDDTELQKISSGSIDIPSMGTTRRMSYVLLEHRATGKRLYYLNVHNSPGNRQSERDRDLAIETAKINELRATGVPVLMGGDMNEREHAVCTVLAKTDLVSSAGGTYAGGVCTPPSRPRIDWIFGSATFSNYVMMQPPLVQRATDHWIVAATATVN